ncbi:MAG: DUF1743 domain-containing protein [Candidatus Thermoplasmatota archaeon]|nr:DUF1743 domain-containing protein [Candidatus Thermoplasmatota archaeon]
MFRLIQALPEHVTVGPTRLVRLWPFAQQRTRGNAAVAVELNTEDEYGLLVFLEQYWKNHILPLRGMVQTSQHNDREQFPSDPGMVWFSESVSDYTIYREGLRRELSLQNLPSPTKSWGGHGRIGATLAILWPAEELTFEAIAWREPSANGLRQLDKRAIEHIDQMEGTFLCRDDRLGDSLLAPKGVSPVLFGIRAWTKDVAMKALEVLLDAPNTEPVIGSFVFETNQATNDHLGNSIVDRVDRVEVLRGGHTVIHASEQRFLAFKESGQIATISQQLREGDVVECKGLMAPDQSIHVEFMKIQQLVPYKHRPACPTCDKSMSSMGKDQGLRCKKCGLKMDDCWIETPRLLPVNQWIQPPASSRRHLAKPLDNAPSIQNNL